MDTRQEDILLYNDRHKDNPLMLYELCVFKKDDAEDILLNRSYKEDGEHKTAGGHIKSATVLITAEIELRPVTGGAIGRRVDPENGIAVWDFAD